MRKEQYRALSPEQRRAYLDKKRPGMAKYYQKKLRHSRKLEQLEAKAKAIAKEPPKEQKLAKLREQIAEIKTKMEGKS